jgi:Domain of unknown function (DUF397)
MGDRIPVGDIGDERAAGDWRKSSYSMSNGHCLEAARLAGGRIGVRDSKASDSNVLRFGPATWSAFLAELRTSPSAKN